MAILETLLTFKFETFVNAEFIYSLNFLSHNSCIKKNIQHQNLPKINFIAAVAALEFLYVLILF